MLATVGAEVSGVTVAAICSESLPPGEQLISSSELRGLAPADDSCSYFSSRSVSFLAASWKVGLLFGSYCAKTLSG